MPTTPNYRRQLFTPQIPPMPPSASHYLNQNHFPTLASHSDVFQPSFVPVHPLPPDQTQRPPHGFHEQPHSHRPQLPTPDVQPRPIKSLPNVSHVPILTGRVNFGAWNDGVRTLILHMGLLGHIANPPQSGYPPLPDRVPSYMPTLSMTPSTVELASYRDWWEDDNIVSHVLIARLNATTRSLLPYDDGDSGMPRCARAIYDVLCNTYHLRGYTSGSALYSELRALSCGPRVQDYVTKWRAGVSQLRSARYPLVFREVIESFLSKLPASVPFQMLRHNTMKGIDNVRDDDVGTFLGITNEVLDIDILYRPGSNIRPPAQNNQNATTRHNHHSSPPTVPPIAPSIKNTSAVPATSTKSTSSSLVCSNCNIRGHTGATCFQPGGGLEGQREQYLANRNRAKAFLAQIEEVLDGNVAPSLTEDTILDTVENIETPPPDPLVDTCNPVPTFSALSISTSPVVSTPDCNDDFFDLYSSFEFCSPIVLSAFETTLPSVQELSSPNILPSAFLTSTFPFNAVLDSGCTHYILRDRANFWTYDTTKASPVKTANCGYLQTLARGTARFRVSSGGRSVVFILNDCLHAPDAPINLISVGALAEKDVTCSFSKDSTIISLPVTHPTLSSFSFSAVVLHRLSFLKCDFLLPPVSPSASLSDPLSPLVELSDTALVAVFPQVSLTPELWHRRFGHLGLAATRAVLTNDYATGTEFVGSFSSDHCIPCLIGKRQQQPFTHHGHRASSPAELLHIDTCGPFPTMTPQKHSSFLTILDDCSNYGYLGLLQRKNDAFKFYMQTEASLENETKSRVATVRFDGAPELGSGDMGEHLRRRGVAVQTTAPYAHQQNGKAERYIRTLVDGMQTLLADSKLPPSFWGWAVSTIQYLRNRLPTSVLPVGVTPFEALKKRKPDLSHLRVWGCQCFVYVLRVDLVVMKRYLLGMMKIVLVGMFGISRGLVIFLATSFLMNLYLVIFLLLVKILSFLPPQILCLCLDLFALVFVLLVVRPLLILFTLVMLLLLRGVLEWFSLMGVLLSFRFLIFSILFL